MNVQDQILAFLKASGPTIPSRVAKNIKTNILIASAHLSDLVSRKKVKMSALKVGSSPLYLLPGQEDQLYGLAENNLKDKDWQVLKELKEKKVLREEQLEVLAKVALRMLKDFAIPLHVQVGEEKELFWKWHLLSEEETNHIIKGFFGLVEEQEKELEPEVEPEIVLEEPKLEPKKEELEIPVKEEVVEKVQEEKIKSKEKPVKKETSTELQDLTKTFFESLDITLDEEEVVRKNSEINSLIIVPSAVGRLKYFCKIRKKKNCDEKDISSAYMESQIKKLPLLFLYTENISKKAKEMLDSGVFENVIVKRIE